MLESFLIFLTGMLASGFGTLVGFGGGIFVVPVLVILFHVQIHLAVGSVVLALLPAALVATVFNARERTIDPLVALWLEIPTMAGAVLGAALTSLIPVRELEVAFAVFVLFMAYKMRKPKPRTEDGEQDRGLLARLNRAGFQLHRKRAGCSYNVGAGAAVLFGSLSGLLAGLFGIGGGFLKTPVMIRVFGMPVRVAVATALFMIVFTSTAASVTHTSLGHLSWPIALPLVAGFAFGAAMGNLMKRRISDARTEKLIAAALFLAGLSMLVHALGKG